MQMNNKKNSIYFFFEDSKNCYGKKNEAAYMKWKSAPLRIGQLLIARLV